MFDCDHYFEKQASNEKRKNDLEINKMQFHNARIEDLAKNSRPLEDGIYAEAGWLHPNENNVYFNASSKHQIRAHFYAPQKFIAGKYYNTYFVNLLVILTMTIGCLIALYFDLLKILIDSFQNIAFKIKLRRG